MSVGCVPRLQGRSRELGEAGAWVCLGRAEALESAWNHSQEMDSLALQCVNCAGLECLLCSWSSPGHPQRLGEAHTPLLVTGCQVACVL